MGSRTTGFSLLDEVRGRLRYLEWGNGESYQNAWLNTIELVCPLAIVLNSLN